MSYHHAPIFLLGDSLAPVNLSASLEQIDSREYYAPLLPLLVHGTLKSCEDNKDSDLWMKRHQLSYQIGKITHPLTR